MGCGLLLRNLQQYVKLVELVGVHVEMVRVVGKFTSAYFWESSYA